MIAGGPFAETWEAYHKYNRLQSLAAWLSLALVLIGTLIWAYGDLLFPEPPDDSEEQTAVVWCGFGVCGPAESRFVPYGSPQDDAYIITITAYRALPPPPFTPEGSQGSERTKRQFFGPKIPPMKRALLSLGEGRCWPSWTNPTK